MELLCLFLECLLSFKIFTQNGFTLKISCYRSLESCLDSYFVLYLYSGFRSISSNEPTGAKLGEQDRTANSHMWMILGLVFMFGYLLLEPWLPESNFEDFYFLGSLHFVFTPLGFIFDGWAQVPFVRDRYGDNYHHRLWGKPIMLGAGGLVLWMMMSLTYVIAVITLFPDVLPPQLPPSP